MPDRLESPLSTAPERISFRRRLLLTVGSALAAAFVLIGALAWFAASAWLNYHNRALLLREAEEITAQTLIEDHLDLNRYAWYEPHHRYAEPRIDPYFVQAFDTTGALLLASDNIRQFSTSGYPQDLLPQPPRAEPSFRPLHRFRTDAGLLYAEVYPVYSSTGTVMAYLQIARFDPGIATILRRVALLLVLGLGSLMLGLGLVVWGIAGRVLRPLESITEATDHVSAAHLSRRLPIPPDADSETAQLATTLNTLLDRLQRAFEETRRFTSDAAHELQTPLTILLGHVEVALRRDRSPEAYRQTLQVLQDEIAHLIDTVRSLLALARLDREGDTLPRTPIDLRALAVHEVDACRAAADAKGLEVGLDAPGAVWVQGHPDLLQKAVRNLLDNAVKYTGAGTITLRVRAEDDRAVLRVEDTGPGIPAAVLPRVTDRFFRAAPTDVPGSGLGLALVEQVVRWHSGTLALTVPTRGGTCARIDLPRRADPGTTDPGAHVALGSDAPLTHVDASGP